MVLSRPLECKRLECLNTIKIKNSCLLFLVFFSFSKQLTHFASAFRVESCIKQSLNKYFQIISKFRAWIKNSAIKWKAISYLMLGRRLERFTGFWEPFLKNFFRFCEKPRNYCCYGVKLIVKFPISHTNYASNMILRVLVTPTTEKKRLRFIRAVSPSFN